MSSVKRRVFRNLKLDITPENLVWGRDTVIKEYGRKETYCVVKKNSTENRFGPVKDE